MASSMYSLHFHSYSSQLNHQKLHDNGGFALLCSQNPQTSLSLSPQKLQFQLTFHRHRTPQKIIPIASLNKRYLQPPQQSNLFLGKSNPIGRCKPGVVTCFYTLFCIQADKLEKLRERMIKVRELFRDTDSTVCHSNDTYVMAVSESSRLHASLKKESVPVTRLIVNQILPPSASDCKFCSIKRKDQMRALDMIRNDTELSGLTVIQAPLVDVGIRGVPVLGFLGDIIWK